MGDKMVALDNLTRVSLQDPRQIYNEKSDDSFSLYDYEYFLEGYQKYKSVNRKVDFTDMLEKFTRIKPVPEIDYLIVDEVQDLSALQWKVVDIISKCVTDTWLAGDDDQAIFGWAGAEAQIFNDHEGEEIVLDQSYRVPKKVHIYATKLISTIINRKEKNYYPTDMEGDVKYIINMDELPTDKGTWYLLARNNEFLKEFEEFCITQGYLFTIKKNEADKLVRNGAIRAVVLYNKLLNGEALTKQNCIDIYAFMATRSRVEYGYKKILEREEEEGRFTLDLLIKNYGLLVGDVWQWQLNRLTETERNYIHLAEDNEDLTEMPRIHISTIHSVKGGEADNVALLPNMLKLSYDQYERDPDEEARVWYVAATRAKKNLYLLAPSETSTYAYPI